MSQEFTGQQQTADDASYFNVLSFIVRQALGRVRTGVPVVIKAVHDGGVGAPPTVDVQPLVNQTDGAGNKVSHATIFGIPVLRIQGGTNAIIVDPAVNDIGWLSIADRDISAVKNAKGIANPGSMRRFNLSDGVYVGAILNPADPDQYIQFTTSGIKIYDKNGNIIEMKSGEIDITATTVKINGNLQVSGDISGTNVHGSAAVIAGFGGADQVGLQTHVHVSNGAPPTPGT